MSSKEKELFLSIGMQLQDAQQGQLFGKPCFKIGGKAFICFFQNEMVFKLSEENHSEALGYDGSQLFDPSGKGRPMKEWVQVSFEHKDQWKDLALAAMNYVNPSK